MPMRAGLQDLFNSQNEKTDTGRVYTIATKTLCVVGVEGGPAGCHLTHEFVYGNLGYLWPRLVCIYNVWKDKHGVYILCWILLHIDRPVWLCSWYLTEATEEEDVQVRPGNRHSRRICRRSESAGVVFTEWPVIGVGKASSSSRSGSIQV